MKLKKAVKRKQGKREKEVPISLPVSVVEAIDYICRERHIPSGPSRRARAITAMVLEACMQQATISFAESMRRLSAEERREKRRSLNSKLN